MEKKKKKILSQKLGVTILQQIRKQRASCCETSVWVAEQLQANAENQAGLCTAMAQESQVCYTSTSEWVHDIHGFDDECSREGLKLI